MVSGILMFMWLLLLHGAQPSALNCCRHPLHCLTENLVKIRKCFAVSFCCCALSWFCSRVLLSKEQLSSSWTYNQREIRVTTELAYQPLSNSIEKLCYQFCVKITGVKIISKREYWYCLLINCPLACCHVHPRPLYWMHLASTSLDPLLVSISSSFLLQSHPEVSYCELRP